MHCTRRGPPSSARTPSLGAARMIDQIPVYLTAAVILLLVASQIFRRDFDPFAPIWLFLASYAQVYVVQAISYRDYALRARGPEVVLWANVRSLWAVLVFLAVYYSGIGKVLARRLPRPPANWSAGLIAGISPVLILWGLVCAGITLNDTAVGEEASILKQFPIF